MLWALHDRRPACRKTGRPRAGGLLALALALALAAPAPAQGPDDPGQCLTSPAISVETDAQARLRAILDALLPHLAAFPSLAETFADRAPALCLETRPVPSRGSFEVTANRIMLKDSLSDGEMLTILIHELRHLEQLDRGYCPSTAVAMEENARAIAALEADANAITALVAWAMREAGDPRAWDAFVALPNYGDIARTFEAEMQAGHGAAAAISAAFSQWYASDWRVETYAMASCSDYLDQLDLTNALPRYDLLPEDFLDRLCRLPDGGAYPCKAAD